jgi:hypothetical protein
VFKAVAVTVTELPAHNVVEVAEMETEGVLLLLTVITIVLEVAVLVDKQVPPVTVITQFTLLAFTGEAIEREFIGPL